MRARPVGAREGLDLGLEGVGELQQEVVVWHELHLHVERGDEAGGKIYKLNPSSPSSHHLRHTIHSDIVITRKKVCLNRCTELLIYQVITQRHLQIVKRTRRFR